MKIWILSDLHLEVAPLDLAIPDADVCVAAGDITRGAVRHVDWLHEEIGVHMPVVSVLGNHEFYGSSIERETKLAADAWQRPECDVYVLQNRFVDIRGVLFVGATLWTDYDLYANGDEATRNLAMRFAQARMNDHHLVALRDFSRERFSPAHALQLHRQSLQFIEATLDLPFAGPRIVVTHHGPSPHSVADQFQGDPLTPAFASDLTALIDKYQPVLWVHGHTHSSFDYNIGRTRVICNPRGYRTENWKGFNPALVVDVVIKSDQSA